MLLRRAAITLLIATLTGLLVVGCDTTPTFDPATSYTPESLASELVFRYKELNPSSRNVRKPQPPQRPGKADTKAAKVATKDAPATTLDDLIRDVATKAQSIPGMTPPEALRKIAAVIDKDPAVTEADRKTIVERLHTAGG